MIENPYRDIQFLQNNVGRNQHSMVTCLEIGLELDVDFILFQEPWFSTTDYFTISHPSYTTILPQTSPLRPRVAIFHKRLSKYKFCQRDDLVSDSDMIAIDILGSDIPDLQLVNIYNERSLREDDDSWTIDRALTSFHPTRHTIIAGDFNAHHSWWNTDVTTPVRATALVDWLQHHGLELLNNPDQATFYRNGMVNRSIIDLVFVTPSLYQRQMSWDIDTAIASGSDHEIISFSIPRGEWVDNPLTTSPYNLQKADWELFSKKLLELHDTSDFSTSNITEDLREEDLEREALNLQVLIQTAAETSIPKRKPSSRSKAWWSEDLTSKRRGLGKARRAWKRTQSSEAEHLFLAKRNEYFRDIKTAKTNCWDSFLEGAKDKEVFKAYSYTKQRLQKLPILKYEEDSREKSAVSFSDKAHAIFSTLFQNPPESGPVDLSQHRPGNWEWPEFHGDEVKEAIFTSSTKESTRPRWDLFPDNSESLSESPSAI